jgi:hypothetical protein
MRLKSTASGSAGQPQLDLVLERMPNGELAWLRPTRPNPAERPAARYVLTDYGRRALAMDALFGPLANVAGVNRT